MIDTNTLLEQLNQENLRRWRAKISREGILVLKTPNVTWKKVYRMYPGLRNAQTVLPWCKSEFEIFVVPSDGDGTFGASFPVERCVIFRSPESDH